MGEQEVPESRVLCRKKKEMTPEGRKTYQKTRLGRGVPREVCLP